MQTKITCQRGTTQGSALLVMLVTVTLIGITLASYLELVRSQNLSTMRSQQWNSAIPILEAGLEEALTHLYYNATNLSANDWVSIDGGFKKERYLGDDKFIVTISATTPPQIVSQAFVREPMGTNFISRARAVQVATTNDALFAKGMVAKGTIDLSGNNIKTDSFDSMDPNYSTAGRYDDDKTKDNGDVATNSAVVDSLNVWNADIYGKASTGPGGTVRIGPNGSVGSKPWHNANQKGIEPGWSSDDMNVSFPDVKPPFTGGAFTPTAGNVGGTNYNYLIANGNYQLTSLSLSGNDKMLVTGHAVLYVTGDVSLTGLSKIEIAPGASLKLYVAGPSTSLGGNGVMNNAGNAMNFMYYGLPSNTSVSMSGNAAFTGTIYAPSAALTLGGGGNNDYDFVGASVTDSVRLNGHYNFHYDENLGRLGPKRGYTITSWNEI